MVVYNYNENSSYHRTSIRSYFRNISIQTEHTIINKKSAFYEDGKRQKERFDNNDLVDQLEAKIRAKASVLDESQRIDIKLKD